MNRSLLLLAGIVLFASCRRAETVSPDTQSSDTAIHSSTAGRANANSHKALAPAVRVLVVADGFFAKDEETFRQTMIPKIRRGFELLPGATAEGIQIELVYLASKSDTNSEPNFDFGYEETAKADCYFKNRIALLPNIYALHDRVKGFSPNRYIVMYAGSGNGACAVNDVMFVRGSITEGVIAHEMGHSLAALLDEYSDGGVPVDCVGGRNCSTVQKDPSWVEGCNHFGRGIYRSAATCRMNNTTTEFCSVCSQFIRQALEKPVTYKNPETDGSCLVEGTSDPWSLPQVSTQGIEVLGVVDSEGRFKAAGVAQSDPATLQPEIVKGDLFVTAYLGAKVVGVASLAGTGKGFAARSYSLDQNGRDLVVEDLRAPVRLTLYGVTREEATSPNLSYGLRRVHHARDVFRIDRATIAKLQASTGATVNLGGQLQSFFP